MGAERKPPSTTTQTRHMTSQVHAWMVVETKPDMAGERGPSGWLAEAGRGQAWGSLGHGLGQPGLAWVSLD